MPITTPFSPISIGDIEGSRLHHWLPRPSRVPDFHRGGVRSLYLVAYVSSLAMTPQRLAACITHLRYLLRVRVASLLGQVRRSPMLEVENS